MPQSMRRILVVIALLLAAGYQYLHKGVGVNQNPSHTSPTLFNSNRSASTNSTSATTPTNSEQKAAVQRINSIIANADTNAAFWTTLQGKVVKVLKDDTEGDRHQRFLFDVGANATLLVVNNIDLAPRVPVQEGATLTLRGEYVWNDKGGVVHWTHHDPKGRPGGWIDYNGKRYQ